MPIGVRQKTENSQFARIAIDNTEKPIRRGKFDTEKKTKKCLQIIKNNTTNEIRKGSMNAGGNICKTTRLQT